MINKNDIEAYMSIKAPDSIKEKIVAEQVKNNDRISSKVRMCYALAAVLLIFVAVFAFLPQGGTELYYNGTSLDKDAVLLTADNPNARLSLLSTSDIRDIPLTVKTDKKTEITAVDGSVTAKGETASELTVDSDTEIIWSVDLAQELDLYTLKVGKATYCMSKNGGAEWTLSKK